MLVGIVLGFVGIVSWSWGGPSWGRYVSYACGALLGAVVMVTDTIFSVRVTFFFLAPIKNLLAQAHVGVGQDHLDPNARNFATLQRTKNATLAGAVLAVGSSTIFCESVLLFMVPIKDPL